MTLLRVQEEPYHLGLVRLRLPLRHLEGEESSHPDPHLQPHALEGEITARPHQTLRRHHPADEGGNLLPAAVRGLGR